MLAIGSVLNWLFAQPLNSRGRYNAWVPLFAQVAKDRYRTANGEWFDSKESKERAGTHCYWQHRTRPCTERKDGAPTFSEREREIQMRKMRKAGPPARGQPGQGQ